MITIISVMVYGNTFEAPFVFDDHQQIVENHRVKNLDQHLTLDNLNKQRPLTNLTFALNYHFHGLDVRGYHLVNLLIHILAGLSVFWLALSVLRQLLKRSGIRTEEYSDFQIRLMALITAMIFVLHPLQTQAVTYIVQRYTSMAALFYILAVLFYILARQRQIRGLSPVRYIPLFLLCLFSGVLAFLSKQSAASLPGILILTEFMLFTHGSQAWRKKLSWIIPLSCVFLVFVFYNTGGFSGGIDFGSLLEDVSSRMQETDTVSRLEYLFTQFTVIPLYIKLFLFPVGLNADPMLPFAKSFFDGFTPWGFLLLLSIIIVGFMARKRYPIIFFAVFWFFITLSVESSIIPIRDAMFEHRMYLPLFGPALLVAWLGVKMGKRFAIAASMFAVMAIVILGFLTYERNKVWSEELLFWQNTVEGNQDNFRAWTNLGLALEREGDLQGALTSYNRALMIKPEFPYALLNLGGLLGKSGNLKDAEDVLKRAVNRSPASAKIRNNLGVVLAGQGKLEESVDHFREAFRADRFFLEASNNLALTYHNLNKHEKAAKQFEESLAISPEDEFAQRWLKRLTGTRQENLTQ